MVVHLLITFFEITEFDIFLVLSIKIFSCIMDIGKFCWEALDLIQSSVSAGVLCQGPVGELRTTSPVASGGGREDVPVASSDTQNVCAS